MDLSQRSSYFTNIIIVHRVSQQHPNSRYYTYSVNRVNDYVTSEIVYNEHLLSFNTL